jgi:DUF1365 family protein
MYLDLNELLDLQNNYYIFSYNSRNILSFYDDDHFKFIKPKNEDNSIITNENIDIDFSKYSNKNTKERIQILAKELKLNFEIEKVFILTNLRNF